MTVHAYVLIQTDVGKAAQVAQQLSSIDGVTVAHGVTGPYDVIAQAEAPSMDDLGRMVVRDMQQIEGITRTITCPVVTHLTSRTAVAAPPTLSGGRKIDNARCLNPREIGDLRVFREIRAWASCHGGALGIA